MILMSGKRLQRIFWLGSTGVGMLDAIERFIGLVCLPLIFFICLILHHWFW